MAINTVVWGDIIEKLIFEPRSQGKEEVDHAALLRGLGVEGGKHSRQRDKPNAKAPKVETCWNIQKMMARLVCPEQGELKNDRR